MVDVKAAPLIYQGATFTDLRFMFKMELKEVQRRLTVGKVRPTAYRGNYPVFNVKEAARYLIDPFEDAEIVEHILRMNHTQLPKMLAKEFWMGKTLKQKYDREAGNLWETTKVVEFAGEAFKTLRLSLQLLADTIERESGLSEKQRTILQQLVDAAQNDMRERLVEAFSGMKEKAELDYDTDNGRPPALEPPSAPDEDGDDEDL